jgi:hypothetical protein
MQNPILLLMGIAVAAVLGASIGSDPIHTLQMRIDRPLFRLAASGISMLALGIGTSMLVALALEAAENEPSSGWVGVGLLVTSPIIGLIAGVVSGALWIAVLAQQSQDPAGSPMDEPNSAA